LINATKNLQNVSKKFQDALNCIFDKNILECLGYVSISINFKNILFIIIYEYFYNNTKLFGNVKMYSCILMRKNVYTKLWNFNTLNIYVTFACLFDNIGEKFLLLNPHFA